VWRGLVESGLHHQGGPEPLQKEIHEILVRNVRIHLQTPFLIRYKIPVLFVFCTCFASAISVRPHGTCESSCRSARRLLGVKSVRFMVPNLESLRHLAHPLQSDLF